MEVFMVMEPTAFFHIKKNITHYLQVETQCSFNIYKISEIWILIWEAMRHEFLA